MFGPCLVIQCFMSVLFFNHLDGEERGGCFTLTVFLVSFTVSILWLLLTVPLVALRCVIVVFPDHTHVLFLCYYP